MKGWESFLSMYIEPSGDWASFLQTAKIEIKRRFHLTVEDISGNDIADLLALDTGAALFWKDVQGTFDDEQIVQKLLEGALLGECGFPDMQWDKYVDDPPGPWVAGDPRDLHCCYVACLSYMASLARIARLKNDRSLCELFARVIDDFYAKNTPSGDLHRDWKSLFWGDMRASWRVQVLWLCFFILCDSEYVGDQAWLKMFHIIFNDSELLYKHNVEKGFTQWNHHSHNMVALVYSAVLMPDMKYSKEWFEFAVNGIMRHGLSELYEDGSSFEACPSYSRFICMHYRDTVLLAKKNNIKLPDKFVELTVKQLEALIKITQPDGSTLPINDSYESNCDFDFKQARVYFGLDTEDKKSVLLANSQIAVMRSDDKKLYMAVDGTRHKMGHWHGGKPGFILWKGNSPLLIEAGMDHYSASDFFMYRNNGGTSHNTVRVDRRGDSVVDADTKWQFKKTARCNVIDWRSDDRFDFLRVENDGFMSLSDPVSFVRTVLFVKGEYFIVTDKLEGQVGHLFEWLAHFPPNKLQIGKEDNSVRTSFADENVFLVPLDKDEIEGVCEHSGKANVQGDIKEIPYISYKKNGNSFNPHILIFPYCRTKPSVEINTIKDDRDMFVCQIVTDEYTDWFLERRALSGNFEVEGVAFESNLLLLRKTNSLVECIFSW